MRASFLFIAALLFGLSTAQAQKSLRPVWKPGTWHKLRVGVSTRDQVLQEVSKLGKVENQPDRERIWLREGELKLGPGFMDFRFSKSILIQIEFSGFLTDDDIKKIGADGITTYEDQKSCLVKGYVLQDQHDSLNGLPIGRIEYPQKGIYVDFSSKRVFWTMKPPKPYHPPCKAPEHKKP